MVLVWMQVVSRIRLTVQPAANIDRNCSCLSMRRWFPIGGRVLPAPQTLRSTARTNHFEAGKSVQHQITLGVRRHHEQTDVRCDQEEDRRQRVELGFVVLFDASSKMDRI